MLSLDTTRLVYQKKLAAILQRSNTEEAVPEQSNGAEEKFSDSEDDDVSVTELVVDPQIEHTEETVETTETVETVETVESAETEPTVSTPEAAPTSIRKRITDRPGSSLNALPLVDKQVSFQMDCGILLRYNIYILYEGYANTATKHPFNQLFFAVHI